MTLQEFHENWHNLILQDDDEERSLVVFLKECLGEHRGGLLFEGRGREKDRMLVLKCDEDDNCYRLREGADGINDRDWQWFGFLIDPDEL